MFLPFLSGHGNIYYSGLCLNMHDFLVNFFFLKITKHALPFRITEGQRYIEVIRLVSGGAMHQ